MSIVGLVGTLRGEIDAIQEKIKQIQAKCSHPTEAVVKVAKSDTGNWCKADDAYWYDCKCELCEKRWTEPQ